MYSLFGPSSKGPSEKASANGDQNWVVVEQKDPGKMPLPSNSHSSGSASIDEAEPVSAQRDTSSSVESTRSPNHHGPTQYPSGIDALLSSINTQRLELADMKKAFLEGQAQIQEERDLFQAQYYALRIQQEEREAHQAEEKEAAWKADLQHLRAELALKLTKKSDELQYMRADVDDVKGALSDESGRSAQIQEQVDKLKQDHELQSAALSDAMEQLRGQVTQIAGQTTELSTAIAQLKTEQNDNRTRGKQRESSPQAAVSQLRERRVSSKRNSEAQGKSHPNATEQAPRQPERRHSRISASDSPNQRQHKRAKVNKTLDNNQDGQRSHEGVRISPVNHATAKSDREPGKYDCEWYLQQPW
ncbi:hypothetical protein Slin15195_G093450 [Septoria linicola]|uniref:Uncharacterized protein n=1 Tax=Septoria linicola TaxID=215465 RepID=A0A9Q9ELQ6_9PEZI|nr:hypothetical protein Slin15195_G093450 [Septoria linicola]